ncbi:transmembrane protein 41B isoform X1 [Chiloscyllium punctatum]|uniref:transmembrane protein 41B isoform X1 n=1 Tax=Chiloscyllium punctatum TaxID=137246 RepID=UPI003B63AE7F
MMSKPQFGVKKKNCDKAVQLMVMSIRKMVLIFPLFSWKRCTQPDNTVVRRCVVMRSSWMLLFEHLEIYVTSNYVAEEKMGKTKERRAFQCHQLLIFRYHTALYCMLTAFVMYLVYRNFPELDEEEQKTIVIPKDMDDAKALGKVLSKYKDTYYVQVLVAYFTTYIFLQTFAIPGSIFLSILSGFLYPFPLALFLVCLCSGLGASFCYMLSYLVGRPIVYKYLTERATKWSQQVDKHREHLINYIIFLRITPFLPNWFINITSPVINVPLGVFFIGTFLGVAPPSFVAIKAGTTLYQLTTAGEAVSWNSVFVLMILAIVSLLPVFFQKKLKQKFS